MYASQTQSNSTPHNHRQYSPRSTIFSRHKCRTEPIQNINCFSQTPQSNYLNTDQDSCKIDCSNSIQIEHNAKEYQSQEQESQPSQRKLQGEKYGNINQKGRDKMNNFENLRVEFKNIQDYHKQKQLQTEAKRFVRRLKLEKQKYKGKFHIIKLKECRKKKEKQMIQKYLQEQQTQQQKEEKRQKSLRKLSNIKKKANERAELLKKYRKKSPQTQQSHTIQYGKSESHLGEKQLPTGCIKRNQIGNTYMNQYGKRNKYRSYSVATERERLLLSEQQSEIDNLRNKIKILKGMMKG